MRQMFFFLKSVYSCDVAGQKRRESLGDMADCWLRQNVCDDFSEVVFARNLRKIKQLKAPLLH